MATRDRGCGEHNRCEENRPEWYQQLSKWTRLLGVARRIVSWRKGAKKIEAGDLQRRATVLLLRQVQHNKFPDDIEALQRGKKLPRESRLLKFRPSLDEDGLLCVGGRLAHANLPMHSKHPVLLAEHHITHSKHTVLLAEHHITHSKHSVLLTEHHITQCLLKNYNE